MSLLSSHGRQRGVFLGLALMALAGCSGKTLQPKEELVPGEEVCPAGRECQPARVEPTLTLIHHLASCEAGEQGEVRFLLGKRELARLRPGESKEVRLPQGDYTVQLEGKGLSEARQVQLLGNGPAWVELGCPVELFTDKGLKPLLVRGSEDLSCPATMVRAAGLRFEVSPGEVRTLFVPVGMYEVSFGSGSIFVEATREGAVVKLPRCKQQGQSGAPQLSERTR